jgi:hypothetical protein
MHIKDIKNGKYIIVNEPTLKIFGSKKIEEMVGLTVHDLDKFMRPFWGDFAKRIVDLDTKVINSSEMAFSQHDVFIDAKNQVYIQDVMKFPLTDKSHKITAIFTTITDRTKDVGLFRLLDLYSSLYPSQSVGLNNFMRYLNLSDSFQEDLTYKEFSCLFHMRLDSSYKNVAKKLNLSVRTIETHASNIVRKIKYGRLSTILSQLRS